MMVILGVCIKKKALFLSIKPYFNERKDVHILKNNKRHKKGIQFVCLTLNFATGRDDELII